MKASQVICLCVILSIAVSTAALTKILPRRVKPGDTVGFISPASNVMASEPDIPAYKKHVESAMATLDLKVKWATHAFSQYGYLAGTDAQRASDIMDMFTDPNVSLIISNRGGWGCNRLLHLLDYDVIARNPKPLVGYSDLTGLINSINHKSGLVTFHGPMGVDNWENVNPKFIREVLMEGNMPTYVPTQNFSVIVPGKAQGRLIGGNLAVFSSLIASPYFPTIGQNEDVILFLEEVGEYPYRIDRMMTTLVNNGLTNRVKGIIFGLFHNCNEVNPTGGFDLLQVLKQKVGDLNIPIFYGADFGHDIESGQIVLPLGTQVAMDASIGTITLLETAVRD